MAKAAPANDRVTSAPAGGGASGENSRREALTAAGLVLLWALFYYPAVAAPWIQGIDSVTRLIHIDQTIVVVLGNPWLPALQLILQAAGMISDSPLAYKLPVFMISLAGMWLFFMVIARLLGFWCAVLSFLYFFVHLQWTWVATSPYMEPLLLLTASAAAYCYLSGRTWLSRFFVAAATFSRPEPLIALPILLTMHLLYYRDFRRAAKFGLLFFPVVLYYLALKVYLPSFASPAAFDWGASLRLLQHLLPDLRITPAYLAVLVLALLGVVRLFLDQGGLPERRRALLVIAGGLILFYAGYAAAVPRLHAIAPSGRFTILTLLPAFVYASLCLDYAYRRWPDFMVKIFLVVIAGTLTYRFARRDFRPADGYLAVRDVLQSAREFSFASERTFYVCENDRRMLTKPDVREISQNGVFLHFRFAGWVVKKIPCLSGETGWKEIAARRKRPLLRLYDRYGVRAEYAKELTAGCRYHSKLRSGRRIVGSICF
jgi:hypothetical protein